ncbi:MAG TPA: hypothetical protein VGA96_18305, partial [Fibrella sp.]
MKKAIVLLVLLGFAACQQQEPDPESVVLDPATSVALRWGQMTLKLMHQLPLNTPTYGSRSLGYVG